MNEDYQNKSSAVAEMGDRLATIDMGRKVRGLLCPPFLWGGELGAHLTQRRLHGPRPTFVPSGICIHPAVWPQQTRDENWADVPLFGGLGPHLTQCRLREGLPP